MGQALNRALTYGQTKGFFYPVHINPLPLGVITQVDRVLLGSLGNHTKSPFVDLQLELRNNRLHVD
jgi:hypothetical protein|uniref:Uncharacterized protein n=1 Tax=Zea mays TaxID=4577 RepID=C4J259_MAIZE|nr:unknown [Zea mays]